MASRKKVKELFAMVDIEKTFAKMVKLNIEQRKKELDSDVYLEEEIKEAMLLGMESGMNFFLKNYLAKTTDRFCEIYAQIFTDEEIEEWIGFASSSTGRKIIENFPEIQAKSNEIINEILIEEDDIDLK